MFNVDFLYHDIILKIKYNDPVQNETGLSSEMRYKLISYQQLFIKNSSYSQLNILTQFSIYENYNKTIIKYFTFSFLQLFGIILFL